MLKGSPGGVPSLTSDDLLALPMLKGRRPLGLLSGGESGSGGAGRREPVVRQIGRSIPLFHTIRK